MRLSRAEKWTSVSPWLEVGYDQLDNLMAEQDRALTVLETAVKLVVIVTGTVLVSTYNGAGAHTRPLFSST